RREADYAIIGQRVVKGLDSQPVARQHESAPRLVPNRKREHAAKRFNRAWSLLFVKVNDGFGVARGLINVTLLLEHRAKIAMVVPLAVVGERIALLFVGHRLVPAGQIND